MRSSFLEKLNTEVLLADGAMGTMLLARGIEPKALMEQNIVNPELIRGIHLEYIRAGAQLIETNTFLANRIRLAEFGVEHDLDAINRAAVRVAREAVRLSGEDVFIAGSVGPLGALVKPYGNLSLSDLANTYTEQIAVLVDEGVDAIIIETHPSLLEALEAVRAAKMISPITPIIAQMTFMEDGRSKFGDDLKRSLEALAAADADVVGLNCSGPQMTYDMSYEFLAATNLPVSIMPNAGLPQFIGGRTVYLSSPEYLREYARRFVEAGANIVGGCCGTTAEHIRAMSTVVRGQVPKRARRPSMVSVSAVSPAEAHLGPKGLPLRTQFQTKLGKEFVVTVEINPPKGVDFWPIVEATKELVDLGVDAVNVNDNPAARVRMSCLAVAHLIQTHTGMETILHFTCRDRSLSLIQSDLLGAAALGIKNVLALTGEPSSVGELPRAPSAYDMNATGLVKIIDSFNRGFTLTGNEIGQPTGFRVGVAVNLAANDLDAELRKLEDRLEAGAQFIQTQPIHDLAVFERFMKRFEPLRVPMLVSILPLISSRHAEFLHHEVPGIFIPEPIRDRMRKADAEGRSEGIEIARELIGQLRPHVAGIHLIPQAEKVEAVSAILSSSLASGV
jgi:homocysteine S-methyltransferase